ncbi:MAG: GTP 3',8-cyclase MoaA [Acidobacteria bacterium]|nr:GTP 3',8-cyclase MoaA [Acidobacteriota bacterium]
MDTFGRVARSLRVSVTDRCNYRCVYCMPEEGVPFLPKREILSYEEIVRLVQVMVRLGVCKVRVTGGEPLLRRDVPWFVRALSRVEGLEDISLTTNGYLLDGLANELYDAGLRRLNVSLDTLRRDRYHQINRVDGLQRVLDGLSAAEAAGFNPIKVNTVLMPGLNEDEILDFARLARERPIAVRFIEFMPMDGGSLWSSDKVVSGREVRERICATYPMEPVPDPDPHAPAVAYRFVDGSGEMGFINPMSEPFCMKCDRIRLSAAGEFRTCIFQAQGLDLKEPLRSGASDEELSSLITDAVARKERGGSLDIHDGTYSSPIRLSMSQVGG